MYFHCPKKEVRKTFCGTGCYDIIRHGNGYQRWSRGLYSYFISNGGKGVLTSLLLNLMALNMFENHNT